MAIVIHDDEASVDGAKDSVPSVVTASQTTAVFDAVADIETRYRRLVEPLLSVLDALPATSMPPAITLPPEYFEVSAALQAQLTAPITGLQADIASMVGISSSTQSVSVISGLLEDLRLVANTVAFPIIDYGITEPDMSWVSEAIGPALVPGFSIPDMSWLSVAVIPAIDYGITLPDMSWVAEAIGPALAPGFSIPDMSWLSDAVIPAIDYGITMPDLSWLTAAVLPTFNLPDISRRMNIVPSIVSVTSSPGRERAPISPDSAVDAWLSSIRSDLPSKRAGMWWALHHSPDAVCHSATSAIELFDHVLYELAPDSIVIAISEDHSEPELFVRDTRFGPQPTWSGRARVAVMMLGGDATAQEFAASFVNVRSQLVKMKHKSHLHLPRAAESALERLDLLLRQLAVYG